MRAGVILYNLKTKQLLLIHRWKNGKEYFVIPGGGVNFNETVLQAAQREIREELGWALSEKKLKTAFSFQNTDKLEVYFFTEISDRPAPAIQGEELFRSHHYNRYQPEWIMIDELDQLNLQPVTLKNLLLEFLIQEGLKKEGNYSKI